MMLRKEKNVDLLDVHRVDREVGESVRLSRWVNNGSLYDLIYFDTEEAALAAANMLGREWSVVKLTRDRGDDEQETTQARDTATMIQRKTKGYGWMKTGRINMVLRSWDVAKLRAHYERVGGHNMPPMDKLISEWVANYIHNVDEEAAWERLRRELGYTSVHATFSKAELLDEACRLIRKSKRGTRDNGTEDL